MCFQNLSSKKSIVFDGDPANLKIFLESFCHRTHTCNWLQIMSIPDHTGTCQSIINEYGQIMMLDVSTDIAKYQGRNCRVCKTAISFTHASWNPSLKRHS